MKRTIVLLAAAIALFGMSRGALSRTLTTLDIKELGPLDIGETPPAPAEPGIFDTLETTTGRITTMSASGIGIYTCKEGAIKLVPGFGGLIRAIAERTKETTTKELTQVAPEVIGGPVKVALDNGKTVIVVGFGAEPFKSVVSLLHAAKLSNRPITIQGAAVPGCTGAYFSADVTFGN